MKKLMLVMVLFEIATMPSVWATTTTTTIWGTDDQITRLEVNVLSGQIRTVSMDPNWRPITDIESKAIAKIGHEELVTRNFMGTKRIDFFHFAPIYEDDLVVYNGQRVKPVKKETVGDSRLAAHVFWLLVAMIAMAISNYLFFQKGNRITIFSVSLIATITAFIAFIFGLITNNITTFAPIVFTSAILAAFVTAVNEDDKKGYTFWSAFFYISALVALFI